MPCAGAQVTEGRPDSTGPHTAKVLTEAGVPVRALWVACSTSTSHASRQVTLVLDSAAAFMMERVDMVRRGRGQAGSALTCRPGARWRRGCCGEWRHDQQAWHLPGESRSLAARSSALKRLQVATVAKACGKPLYVAAESYKFARLYPLNQRDLPYESKPADFAVPLPESITVENPSRDYTPPHLITLLFTDLGVLTPSAVSDELIQLYL